MNSVLKNICFIIIVCLTNVTSNTCGFEPAKGQHSIVKSLGQLSDFEKIGPIFLVNRDAWGQAGKKKDISYRVIKKEAEADIFLTPLDIDNKGLPKNNMILEILYQDRAWQKEKDKSARDERVRIKFRTDFSKENQYEEVGWLKAEGDNKWKLARVFCEKTPRQFIRAIDGSLQFKISMPKAGSREILISYIRLASMDQQEFLRLREEERAERGLTRVEYVPKSKKINPSDKCRKLGFVAYQVNCLKLVFPNSVADYGHAGLSLKCFEIPGQIESASFVIHAFEDLSAVSVKVSDLLSEKDSISSDMIDVRKVCFNDQRWGWSWAKTYGKCPDYLGFSNPEVDISENSNCQFWLTISIPQKSQPGKYKGNVTLNINGEEVYAMELLVDVLPVSLLTNKVKHLLYHSPYWKVSHSDPLRILDDMKKHGLTPIFCPNVGLVRSGSEYFGDLDVLESQLQSFRKVYPETKEIFVMLGNPRVVWRRLKGPKPEFTKSFPDFEKIYGKVLKQCADLGKSYGLEIYFSFEDEPFKKPDRRRVAYLCSRIAQSIGLKTWSTHNLNYDVQLELNQYERSDNINYLQPLRPVLDVFVEYVARYNSNVIRAFRNNPEKLSYYTTYHCTSIRPMYNRFLHGIYPFVTNGRFVFSYAYRDAILDPFDDMDSRAGILNTIGMNDYLLTYPTWQGDILPTLSYEALREGIEDSHLISTLQILTDKALQSDNSEISNLGRDARNYMNGIIKRINKNFRASYYKSPLTSLVDAGEKAILKDLNGEHGEEYEIFNKIRRTICAKIVALQNAYEMKKAIDVDI